MFLSLPWRLTFPHSLEGQRPRYYPSRGGPNDDHVLQKLLSFTQWHPWLYLVVEWNEGITVKDQVQSGVVNKEPEMKLKILQFNMFKSFNSFGPWLLDSSESKSRWKFKSRLNTGRFESPSSRESVMLLWESLSKCTTFTKPPIWKNSSHYRISLKRPILVALALFCWVLTCAAINWYA